MLSVPLYKRILSYLMPVRIRQGSSTENPVLELLLYKGQYQLATEDALYSDGRRYRPIVLAFREIHKSLPFIKKVLLLGTGIGSTVQIMGNSGFYPEFTMVEKDSTILSLADEVLQSEDTRYQYKAVNTDAAVFIEKSTEKFDLIVVDIFNGRVVPPFVTTAGFLEKCLHSLSPEGILIMNYIINDVAEWNNALDTFSTIFPDYEVLGLDVNRILIARA